METAARTSRPMGGMNFAFIHPRMLAATRQCLPLLCRTQTFKRIVSKPNPTDMRHKTGCGIISVGSLAWSIRRGRVAFPERVKSGRPLYGEVGNVKDSTGRLKQLLAAFRSSLDLSAFAKGPAFRISRAPAYSLRDENER